MNEKCSLVCSCLFVNKKKSITCKQCIFSHRIVKDVALNLRTNKLNCLLMLQHDKFYCAWRDLLCIAISKSFHRIPFTAKFSMNQPWSSPPGELCAWATLAHQMTSRSPSTRQWPVSQKPCYTCADHLVRLYDHTWSRRWQPHTLHSSGKACQCGKLEMGTGWREDSKS